MAKNNKNILIFIVLIGIGLFLFFNQETLTEIQSSILPELDNRITYSGEDVIQSQFVQISLNTFENDRWVCQGTYNYNPDNGEIGVYVQDNVAGNCYTKKDFSRLNVFIRTVGFCNGELNFGNVRIGSEFLGCGQTGNFEIEPDNLNIGIYNIFVNGEYFKRETIDETNGIPISIASRTDATGSVANIVSLKYVPPETFTIKNDEVWVKEVRGSDYSVFDLNWEMIGYHSQIRPATIRDLTEQTEKPAPQIYVNLINGLPVKVQPNTVHTFFYKTKWTEGLDSSCKGDLDKVEVKIGDKWVCESYVKETPIIQQCQTKEDCPILPECEAQKDLIECVDNFCDYTLFSPACKNQLITYQEKIVEIEKTKFIPIPAGANSFFCFFSNTKNYCDIGEKRITVTKPEYVCGMTSEIISTNTKPDSCWKTTLSFDGNDFDFQNNGKNENIGFNITSEISMSAILNEERKTKYDWNIVGKFTLPDDFLELKSKELGNKFVLQNSDDKITFVITNNLGFGIDGGYIIQTQNLALEGGTILRNERKDLFLNKGDNDITYNFETSQLGTIVDIIGVFGKATTDKEYIFKSSRDGKEKFLVLTKEIVTELPTDLEKLQPIIVEKETVEEVIKEIPTKESKIPIPLIIILSIAGIFLFLKLLRII